MTQNNSIYVLQKRLLAVILLVTFVFLGVCVRLFYIQVIDNEKLQAKAMDQWLRDLPLNAPRGEIVDTNGVKLATNYTTFDIYVRPSRVKDSALTALTISNMLGLNYEDTFSKVTNARFSEIRLKKGVKKDVVEKLVAENLSGVMVSQNTTRFYPYGNCLTQVLGFTNIDNVGQAGLEAYYNKYLMGVNGYVCEESDVRGNKIDNTLTTYVPAISGCNINLTIDANIQVFCEDALRRMMEEQKCKKGSIICVNPKTGEILAMATAPNFDLNNVPRDDVGKLMETVKNINVVDVYEPGSTFKVITMAHSIEKGVAKMGEIFVDPGYRMVDGEKIKCWKLKGHGVQTLSEGLCNSCNSVFVDLALRLGKDGIYDMFNTFNLGQTLGIDYSGESAGLLMNYDTAKTVDVARMGFGQAVAVTPIQEIMAISSVMNGGKLMQPYFVKNVTSAEGDVIYEKTPKVLKNTISEATSAIMRQMFVDVVKQYSGYYAFIPGYMVGGKTGTTQKYENGRISGQYIASFCGSLPADNPEYVILVVADEPQGNSYYGSIVATPYAKMIFENIIKYKNLQPNENLLDDVDFVKKDISMPDLKNVALNDAMKTLEKLHLQYEIAGENEKVMYTYPVAGTMLSKNSIVLLQT